MIVRIVRSSGLLCFCEGDVLFLDPRLHTAIGGLVLLAVCVAIGSRGRFSGFEIEEAGHFRLARYTSQSMMVVCLCRLSP